VSIRATRVRRAALDNVSQQLGSALGIAVVSTLVATATNHYLTLKGVKPGHKPWPAAS
jgi:hypothetical protein